MAGIKVTDLPVLGAAAADDVLYIVDTSTNTSKQIEVEDFVGYKVYTALLTQSGTDAPVATVLKNTIGTITLSYSEEGGYLINCVGNLFTADKTVVFCSSIVLGDASATDFKYLYSFPRTEGSVGLNLFKIDFGTPEYITTDGFTTASIEIRVYP
jgi:hypothetical protein